MPCPQFLSASPYWCLKSVSRQTYRFWHQVWFCIVSSVMLSLSRVQLFAIPWTVVRQAPLSMGVFRQEYWSGLPFPSPEDLPNPGIEPRSPALQADSLPFEPQGSPLILDKHNLFSIKQIQRPLFLSRLYYNPGRWEVRGLYNSRELAILVLSGHS